MKYKELAELYEHLSSTTKRLEKTEMLSEFLKKLHESDKEVLYLLLGDIYPEYSSKKIGISSQLVIKALSKASGVPNEHVVKEWKSLGDLGKVAESLMKNKKQHTLQTHVLTTEKVLENMRKLPELEGKGTVDKKLALIVELLTSASPIEALYLVRTLMGDLRIGIKESTIREAMTKAFYKGEENAAKKVQDAINKSNDLSVVFEIVKTGKTSGLGRVKLEIGKPVKVMLAQKASTIKEGFEAVGKPCAVEYKYDGFRLLIHKKGKEIKLFTRRLEEVTKQFPEVADSIRKYVKADTAILDSEAVGYDKKTKAYKPFQAISQRIKRKYDIEKMQEELPVEINVFDILYYDGKSLLDEPFRKRTELVRKIVSPHPLKIVHAKQIITDDEKKAEEFFKQALKNNQEGVMMKNLDSIYQPGSRVGFMLKVKPQEKDFDLVIVGGEYGTGKRGGWISSFILACREDGKFLEIGKVGTGFKEKKEEGVSFHELTEKIKPLITEEKGKSVKIKPKIVVSVTYQEIQKSPTYSSGFALRFPRFTALRPDRNPSDITTLKEVKADFEKQKRNWRYG
ncbi:MAG TPA: ATP-dependent DNA ligase [Patescibacteria group bacterium]|nr:ATP-dependent DNA ligase [Patescibacteria group bacterium]